jgi:hypothetical protein
MLGMLDKKDKLAALIVGGSGPSEKEHEEKEMDIGEEAKKDAARQLLSAIERKDISALVDAFDTFRGCYED